MENISNLEPVRLSESDFIIRIFGGIDDKVANDVCTKMTNCYLADPLVPIKLQINSPGGYLTSAISIVSTISTLPSVIDGLVVGQCMSAATLILAACDRRIAFENTIFMTHQYTAGSFGSYSELVSGRNHQDRMHQIMIDIYSKSLGMNPKEVQSKLLPEGKDVFFDEKFAKQIGLVHKIVPFMPGKNTKLYLEFLESKKPELTNKSTNRKKANENNSRGRSSRAGRKTA